MRNPLLSSICESFFQGLRFHFYYGFDICSQLRTRLYQSISLTVIIPINSIRKKFADIVVEINIKGSYKRIAFSIENICKFWCLALISIYVIQVVSKFMHNSSFYGGITLFDVYLMIVEICDTFYGAKLSSKNIISNILICYIECPSIIQKSLQQVLRHDIEQIICPVYWCLVYVSVRLRNCHIRLSFCCLHVRCSNQWEQYTSCSDCSSHVIPFFSDLRSNSKFRKKRHSQHFPNSVSAQKRKVNSEHLCCSWL